MKLKKEKAELLLKMQYRPVTKYCYINGEKFEFNVDSRFSPEKTKKLIDELIKYIAVTHETGTDEFRFTDMIFSLILKHFTDVPLYDRQDIEELEPYETLEVINNVAQVTNSLASIVCDDGQSVLQFLQDNIEESEITKLQQTINQAIIALSKFTEYRDETEKLMVQLAEYLENTVRKIEQAHDISDKIKYLEEGGERVFEKEVD